jgi:hypothetical protein
MPENKLILTLDDFINHLKTQGEQVDESVKAYLSKENIIEIFYSYIIKHKIEGIDNIDNDSFRKNMASHVDHISGTINDYHYSPYLEKLISKGKNKNPRVISIPTIKDRIVLYVLKELLHQYFPKCVNNELVNMKIKEIYQIISESNSVEGAFSCIVRRLPFRQRKLIY